MKRCQDAVACTAMVIHTLTWRRKKRHRATWRTDRIWFRGLGLEEDDLTITDTERGALVDVGDMGSILLLNVLASDLHQDDFIF